MFTVGAPLTHSNPEFKLIVVWKLNTVPAFCVLTVPSTSPPIVNPKDAGENPDAVIFDVSTDKVTSIRVCVVQITVCVSLTVTDPSEAVQV